MITREEFKIMQESLKCLLQVIFDNEDKFKQKFITPCCRYEEKDYEIHNCHISSCRAKIIIRFYEDYSEAPVYINLTDLLNWYYDLAEEKGIC